MQVDPELCRIFEGPQLSTIQQYSHTEVVIIYYSLYDIRGCRHPNLEPIELRAKKALQPDVHLSIVRKMLEE